MERITIFTDGASRGNPGQAAVGVQILDAKGKVLKEVSETIGNATSNYANYFAVIRALQVCQEHFGSQTYELHFEIKLDSELVKKQLSNEAQIKDISLIGHFIEIHNMRVESFPNLTLTLVSRKKNKEADRLVNKALDGA